MKRILATTFTITAIILAGASITESVALAAQKRSTSPALRRGTRARTPARRVEPAVPKFVKVTLPRNQYFRLRLNQSLSSATARRGDRFKATVVTPVYAQGVDVVPAGSIVEGRVTAVTAARSRGREGELGMSFDTLILPDGTRRPLTGSLTELQNDAHGEVDEENRVSGNSSENRNIIYVGGGGVGGAVLGGVIGGGKGAAIGAILGAGAGVAGSLIKKGNEAEIKSGTEIGMVTTQPIIFSVKSERPTR